MSKMRNPTKCLRRLGMVVCIVSLMMGQSALAAPITSFPYVPHDDVMVVGNNVIVGFQNVGSPDSDNQPVQKSGVAVPINVSAALVTFGWGLSTWDSYNAPLTSPATGYWDSFSVTLTKDAPYWDFSPADPVVGDAQSPFILDVATTFIFSGHGSGATEEFGGFDFADGTLENSFGPRTTFSLQDPGVAAGTAGNYYVNFMLDTETSPQNNGIHPSWGTYSDVDVAPVPEPSTVLLLGSGLAGLGAWRWKKSTATKG